MAAHSSTTSTTAKAGPTTSEADTASQAEAAPAISTTVVTETAVVKGPDLKKKDFIDRVVERSGGKKKDVKPAVEAALAILGEAIAAGEELVLPPLGKLKVNREKDLSNAKVYICKLRRSKTMTEPGNDPEGDDPTDPLADAAE
ncbi:HU family DNA-binding protein [Roseisalinus antarcticus]|uniref:Bacterial DNA-binding protein n=1 Tax=Roseisalinus antarcticus TaxID=254357 RepID=A0A1Y5RHZ3_9RHOB|nr:HU family DNA-binding protein [Roseisalinus antarcticus]SLN17925.1 Bacterial DNA-binding protein [Roseisalinus antarcticus]